MAGWPIWFRTPKPTRHKKYSFECFRAIFCCWCCRHCCCRHDRSHPPPISTDDDDDIGDWRSQCQWNKKTKRQIRGDGIYRRTVRYVCTMHTPHTRHTLIRGSSARFSSLIFVFCFLASLRLSYCRLLCRCRLLVICHLYVGQYNARRRWPMRTEFNTKRICKFQLLLIAKWNKWLLFRVPHRKAITKQSEAEKKKKKICFLFCDEWRGVWVLCVCERQEMDGWRNTWPIK